MALTNDTLAARKALQAYLTVSADAGSVIRHRGVERPVELAPASRRRPRILAADHDPIRVQPVVDGVALPEELGVRHHDRVGPAQGGHHHARRPDGDGGLGDHDRARFEVRRDLGRGLLDEAQIGGAVGALGGRDAEEDEVGARGRLGGLGRETTTARLPGPPRSGPAGPPPESATRRGRSRSTLAASTSTAVT